MFLPNTEVKMECFFGLAVHDFIIILHPALKVNVGFLIEERERVECLVNMG